MRMSRGNKRMLVNPVYGNGGLAVNRPLEENPAGYVRVTCAALVVFAEEHTRARYCYWSRNEGVSALRFSELQAGDELYWNALNGGWWALGGTEIMEFDYVTLDDDHGDGPILEGARRAR